METLPEAHVRLIAFYLPQFHPIPENDQWWGTGFTEWTNVANTRPRFRGHYQPHLPSDLGFYDLRLPESRQAQADLAASYGIHGFCYYHYWFQGRRLLERPFNEVLASGEPDLPFCLCWANENWTRAWDGKQRQILMPQVYSAEDDINHIRHLAAAFSDKRYIRIDGKPLFIVYRSTKLPSSRRSTDLWREESIKLGIGELYLCRVESFSEMFDPIPEGFDASIEFQPVFNHPSSKLCTSPLHKVMRLTAASKLLFPHLHLSLHSYQKLADHMATRPAPPYPRFPCVTPSWDNSPRRSTNATVYHGSTPEVYQRWLLRTIRRQQDQQRLDKVVFVNAWNEWAEGAHLEPDMRFGHGYLNATRKALTEASMHA
ncbi:MAG: glycoside hydrolase family 99-like domain-containing protein [Syntrophobacteraceae bacterium]